MGNKVAPGNQQKIEPTFEDLDEDDAYLADEYLDDSYELICDDDDDVMICKKDQIPKPIEEKPNDIISKHKVFVTHVSLFC